MQHDNYIAELDFGKPQIDDQAFVAPTAVVVGAVTMGPRSSIWYGAVARADAEPIEIGEGSNVQDGCTLHSDAGFPLVIGRGVTVGHRVVLHGARVDDDVLVGMGSIVHERRAHRLGLDRRRRRRRHPGHRGAAELGGRRRPRQGAPPGHRRRPGAHPRQRGQLHRPARLGPQGAPGGPPSAAPGGLRCPTTACS